MSYMAYKKTNLPQAIRRQQVQQMWEDGRKKQEIADLLAVSHRTIARDFEALSLQDKVPVIIGQAPDKYEPAIPVGKEAAYLMNKAVLMIDGWYERALIDDKAAAVLHKFADMYAKLVGAYAPEKKLQGSFKLEPPKPIEVPADVVKDMGEIIGELQIEQDNTG